MSKTYPEDRFYTKAHEWARKHGELVQVGISEYAVEQLGDITLVDLPPSGTAVAAGERFGDIESVKTVSELFAPIAGEVVENNPALEDRPELVNEDPYDKGWMVTLRPTNADELTNLLSASDYAEFVATLDD